MSGPPSRPPDQPEPRKLARRGVASSTPMSNGWHLPVLLVIAFVSLVAGLTLPIMEVTQFWIFGGTYSILGSIFLLLREGEVFTGLVLFGFSVLLPAVKIVMLLWTWAQLNRGRPPPPRLTGFLELIGKWSMLDVMVVALIIFAAKAGALVDANVAPAVIPFVASIGLTIYCAGTIKQRVRAASELTPP